MSCGVHWSDSDTLLVDLHQIPISVSVHVRQNQLPEFTVHGQDGGAEDWCVLVLGCWGRAFWFGRQGVAEHEPASNQQVWIH